MKNLFLLSTLLLLLSSCKFGSSIEAKEACREWRTKGGFYYVGKTYVNSKGRLQYPSKFSVRECRWDKLTNQYLGYEYSKVKKNQKFVSHQNFYSKKYKKVVVKRFKY